MLRENREVNSSFPKKEGWGSFLAIKIQRELKDEIPLHLFLHLANGHFSACVTDLAPFRSPPHFPPSSIFDFDSAEEMKTVGYSNQILTNDKGDVPTSRVTPSEKGSKC